MSITQFQAALYDREPELGAVNPPGEVVYAGYQRVQLSMGRPGMVFPASEQDEPVWVSHIVVLDPDGRVVGSREISEYDLKSDGSPEVGGP